MKTNLRAMLPAVLLLVPAMACSEGTPTGTAEGTAPAEVRIHGDAPAETSESRSATTSASGELDGSLEVTARVWVQSEGGRWVEVTRGSAEQTVEASGEDGFRVLARSEIEAQSYNRVRVEFERVRGDLSGAVLLGLAGGSATVALDVGGDGRVTVEREIHFAASSGATTRLDIDLNAPAWAGESDGAGMVAEGAFASAVGITAR
ncbi:MAG TPA: hypothetical protein VFZ18_06180 [Longimicrobiaceae bacterium]